jgi:hypothetical protein
LDTAALTQNLPELGLYKGQVGTIIEIYEPTIFEVEFVDRNGETYAFETLNANQVMQIYYTPLPQIV